MGKRSDYKKHSEFAAWDMDKGCRNIVNQHSPGKRRLRKRLMRQARRRYGASESGEIDFSLYDDYVPCYECSALGDDYWINEDGEIESFCEICSLYKSRKDERE